MARVVASLRWPACLLPLRRVVTATVHMQPDAHFAAGSPLLQEDFDKAAEEAKALPENTSNDDKLALYGLFKQASVGDINTARPGIFDPKGKAKWDAWEKQKGKSQEAAMQEYIDLVQSLKAKYA